MCSVNNSAESMRRPDRAHGFRRNWHPSASRDISVRNMAVPLHESFVRLRDAHRATNAELLEALVVLGMCNRTELSSILHHGVRRWIVEARSALAPGDSAPQGGGPRAPRGTLTDRMGQAMVSRAVSDTNEGGT